MSTTVLLLPLAFNFVSGIVGLSVMGAVGVIELFSATPNPQGSSSQGTSTQEADRISPPRVQLPEETDCREYWGNALPIHLFTTNITDPNLLKRSLEGFGLTHSVHKTTIKTAKPPFEIYFRAKPGEPFTALFRGQADLQTAQEQLNEIGEEYARLVQQDVYEKLMQRARSAGLLLESEKFQQDDSIVLTFQVME